MVISEIEKPYIYKALEKFLSTENIFEWMESRAEQLSNLGRLEAGVVRFTRKLRDACEIKAIVPNNMGARARIWEENKELFVEYKPKLTEDAIRIAVAHEFGHAIWFILGRGDSLIGSIAHERMDSNMELLCDYFAGALLVPRKALMKYLENDNLFKKRIPPVHLIREISRNFVVPERIAAWRILLVGEFRKTTVISVRDLSMRAGPLIPKNRYLPDWETNWYTMGSVDSKGSCVKGYTKPFETHRKIPKEMIPNNIEWFPKDVDLDCRWWEGIRCQVRNDSRIPMRFRQGTILKKGFVSRRRAVLYLALS